MKKRVGIIGAGRFGMSLAESLMNAGSEVVLLDRNRPAMQSASEFATAIQGDATQPHVLQEAGFDECDVVVVAIGSNIEASMMATANCKELGVKTVISKASSELHGKILRRIGADSVIYPDRDSAHRLARAISNHDIVDFLEVSEGYSIAEIDVPEDMRGQTLAEANFRKETGLIVLCIRRASEDPKKPRSVIIPQASEQRLADER
ncbi:MAG: TrkA family potassium uptake protein, partial [Kiritimatiellae bacterium]|nr:TrkA family potassium uptake protein [Kiritimatiellia bacterium]